MVRQGSRRARRSGSPMGCVANSYSIGDQLTEALLRHNRVSRGEATDRAVFLLEKVGITAARGRLRF